MKRFRVRIELDMLDTSRPDILKNMKEIMRAYGNNITVEEADEEGNDYIETDNKRFSKAGVEVGGPNDYSYGM